MLPCCIIAGLTFGIIGSVLLLGKKVRDKVTGKETKVTKWVRPIREVS